VAFLNEYLTIMVDCVIEHGGVLDKFIGDAVMAVFGAPISAGSLADDARAAVACAQTMGQRLDELNLQRAATGLAAIRIGIGVHTGDLVAGNIGSPKRMQYTVIGDTVNVANRLCSLAGGGEIVVSDAVRDALSDPSSCTPRRDLAVARQHGTPPEVWQVMSTGTAS
jgi:adenylate cyclase